MWGDARDSSRSYGIAAERRICGFSGETRRDETLRVAAGLAWASVVWLFQISEHKRAGDPAKSPSRPCRPNLEVP